MTSTGAALHYRVEGPENGPVLVLGPSLGTDLHFFDEQVAAWRGHRRLIRFDLPGHGGSPTNPGASYDISSLAEDLVEMLDSLGVRRFSYLGVSIGGAIGQKLGLRHGERLDRLVVCATAARFGDPASWWDRAARVREEGTEPVAPSRTGTWFTADFAARCPQEAERLLGMLRATSPDGYAGCCEAIASFDVRDCLVEISVPTRVIAGAEDPATPVETCRAVADGIPGADLVVVPGAAHFPNVEEPGLFNAVALEHLEGN